MNHIVLFLVCILSIEVILLVNFFYLLNLTFIDTKKIINIASSNKISDHWKERSIPSYALKIIKTSIKIILIAVSIILIFIIPNIFMSDFINFVSSSIGIVESLFFAIAYFYLRKAKKNE